MTSAHCNFTGSLTLLELHPSYLRAESIKRKKNEYQIRCSVLKWNYQVKWIWPEKAARYHFIFSILLSWLKGKLNWHWTNVDGPVNMSIVEITTPVWNVSWTVKVNPCFVWDCPRCFCRTIIPSMLCLNHLSLNIICAECDSYPWQLRTTKDHRVNFY